MKTSNISYKPSGVFATIERGGLQSLAMLNEKLPRWDFVTNGSYVAVPESTWSALWANHNSAV